jgi:ligand-binding sensor domain-containing protein
MVIDQDGVLWIGVTLGGLISYDGNDWEKYTPDDCGLLSDFILDIAVDRSNRKWITTNAGISVFNGTRWTSYTSANSGLPDDIVPAIVIDKDNVKWFGTLGGLARYDGQHWTVWSTRNSPLPSDQVNDISIDENGLLWIATNNGAAVFDGVDNWVTFTSKNSLIPAGNIYKVACDGHGTVWFGNDAKGLAKLSGFHMPTREVASNDNPSNNTRTSSRENDRDNEPANVGPSDERVRINPHLEDGYVTISFESPSATVTFINKDGKVVKTAENYTNNQRIKINRMPRGMYTVSVKTVRGEKRIKFNLK